MGFTDWDVGEPVSQDGAGRGSRNPQPESVGDRDDARAEHFTEGIFLALVKVVYSDGCVHTL